MAVGSLTISATSNPGAEAARRRRSLLIKNTAYFLASLVASYMAVAVVTNVLKVNIAALRPIEALGGAIILVFGLAFLRLWGPVARLENAFAGLILRLHPRFSRYVEEDIAQPSLNPRLASTVGSCLSLVCSTAGAPTLSTSIVLPLMVYAGLSGLEWSFLILLAYLVAVSIPFLLVTVGLGELLLTRAYRLVGRVLVVNGFLLTGVGVLLVAGPNTVIEVLLALVRLLFYGGAV
jgi:hypothetical protein